MVTEQKVVLHRDDVALINHHTYIGTPCVVFSGTVMDTSVIDVANAIHTQINEWWLCVWWSRKWAFQTSTSQGGPNLALQDSLLCLCRELGKDPWSVWEGGESEAEFHEGRYQVSQL